MHDTPDVWRSPLVGASAGLLLASLGLWPSIQSLLQTWQTHRAYQFGWLVLPVVAYLLGGHNRATTLNTFPRPDFSGVALAFMAALAWSAAELMNVDAGRQLSAVLAIQGICMATLGWRPYWKLAPTLWLMFLMVPSGDLIQPVLRHVTVAVIALFATAMQLPHEAHGYDVIVGRNEYVVLNECAGLPYFLLATFLGYTFALMLYRSRRKILAFTLFSAFIGIVSNALRVCAIVLVDWVQGSQMPLSSHGNIQWVALLLSMTLLFYVLTRLERDPLPHAEGSSPPIPPVCTSGAWRPPFAAGLIVLAVCLSVSWKMALPTPAFSPSHPSPDALVPGNERQSSDAGWTVDAASGTHALSARYHHDGNALRLRIVEVDGQNAKIPAAALAPEPGSRWSDHSTSQEQGCAGSSCITIEHTVWENGETEERRHVYATYAIGRHFTTSRLAVRAIDAWSRLTGDSHGYRLIGVELDAAVPSDGLNRTANLLLSVQRRLEAPAPATDTAR